MRYTRTLLLCIVILLIAACGRRLPDDVPMAGSGSALQESADEVVDAAATDPVVVEAPADDASIETVAQQAGLRGEVIVSLSRVADPENGADLFNTLTADDFTCADCHSVTSAETTVGPGLFDIPNRIALAGEVPQVRLYNAIVDPSVHPVLSEQYTDLMTNAQIYDVLAYMMTLRDPNSVVVDVQVTPEVAVAAAPTEAPQTAETADTADDGGGEAVDQVAMLVSAADATNGQTLFNQNNATGFACSTCHSPDSDAVLVGPGLLGIPTQAAVRVVGQSAQTYLFNSILHPNDYVVGDFAANLMPGNYGDIYSTREIYDIVAYLMTLDG